MFGGAVSRCTSSHLKAENSYHAVLANISIKFYVLRQVRFRLASFALHAGGMRKLTGTYRPAVPNQHHQAISV